MKTHERRRTLNVEFYEEGRMLRRAKITSKEIPLTQGKAAIVDDQDFEWLTRYKWCAHKNRNTFYAIRQSSRKNGKQTKILMHRELLGLKSGDPWECDHKDGDGLNNRRDNLRFATRAQNHQNARSDRLYAKHPTSSRFKGVCWHRGCAKWQAQIWVEGRQTHLGYFDSETEAAHAYDDMARKYFGEFARLNFGIGDIRKCQK